MTVKNKHCVALLLLTSGLLLSSLVPGGPIENRDFSHINPAILLGFNIYLTLLGLGSFVLIAHVLRSGRRSGVLGAIAGFSYLVVYALDLLGWFPQTPSAMPAALLAIEWIGMILAIPLVYLSLEPTPGAGTSDQIDHWSLSKWMVIAVAGAAIVLFATWSAMAPAA